MAIPVLNDLSFSDGVALRLGDSDELSLFHNSSGVSYLQHGVGPAGGGENMVILNSINDKDIQLYTTTGSTSSPQLTLHGDTKVSVFSGEVEATILDISGDARVGGTLETDALTIGGSAISLNHLSNVLIENNSIWIGNDPSSTTSTAERNIAIGTTALDAITTGNNNIAIGYDALTAEDAGGDSIAIGAYTLANQNTTAASSANIAIGQSAGNDITTGTGNIIMGYAAGNQFTTGPYNVVIGYGAMSGGTDGSGRNVFIGASAGEGSGGGVREYNVGVGAGALNQVTTGDNNVAIGADAGLSITTGDNNVILGYDAEPSAATTDNEIVIGAEAAGHGANIIVLGNATHTAIHPGDDNGVDLGSASYSFKDGYFDGSVKCTQNFRRTVTTASDSSNTHTCTLTDNDNFNIAAANAATTIALVVATENIGQSGIITITNPASVGSLSFVALPSYMLTPSGATINFDTSANGVSVISYYVLATDKVLCNYIGNFA